MRNYTANFWQKSTLQNLICILFVIFVTFQILLTFAP